jgi:carbamoyl-phosphate synthase small subunit
LRGIISTLESDPQRLVERARGIRSMLGADLASAVTCPDPYEWPASEGRAAAFRVVAYDYGIKRNILRNLARIGCAVRVVPAATRAEDTLALKPDGVFLSNGPGDPEPLEYAVSIIRKLMGLAFGGKTFKLKFGHRGGNQPVKNLRTGQVEITAQNHGFAVDPDSLSGGEVDLTHVNLNDHTLEGMRHRSLPAFSVQYHPEASPGPHDSHYLFEDFKRLMEEFRR